MESPRSHSDIVGELPSQLLATSGQRSKNQRRASFSQKLSYKRLETLLDSRKLGQQYHKSY